MGAIRSTTLRWTPKNRSPITGRDRGWRSEGLAPPPDLTFVGSRLAVRSALGDEDASGTGGRHCRPRPRPPPAPRPRPTAAEPAPPARPSARVYSRDSSLERVARDSSGERHPHARRHAHARRDARQPCWCGADDDCDSCEDRRHLSNQRHSYHEGLHRAHLLAGGRCPQARRSVSPRCPLADPAPLFPYAADKVGRGARFAPSQSDYIPLWSCHSPLVRPSLFVACSATSLFGAARRTLRNAVSRALSLLLETRWVVFNVVCASALIQVECKLPRSLHSYITLWVFFSLLKGFCRLRA